MVRLKVIEEVPDFFPTWFQFHYGTIKRLRAQRVERLVAEFQFHYGTIKSEKDFAADEGMQISIPLWYD